MEKTALNSTSQTTSQLHGLLSAFAQGLDFVACGIGSAAPAVVVGGELGAALLGQSSLGLPVHGLDGLPEAVPRLGTVHGSMDIRLAAAALIGDSSLRVPESNQLSEHFLDRHKALAMRLRVEDHTQPYESGQYNPEIRERIEEDMGTIASRLAQKLKEHDWSEGELSRRSSVPQPTINRILSGESQSPRRPNVEKLARALGVAPEWLLFGAADSNVEPGPPITSPFRAVKIVGTAQMGTEGYWYQLDEGDGVVDVPSSDPGAYALRLKGDSMAPAIRSGWIAIIEPNRRLVPGEYVMIRLHDDESMLKELLYANDVEVSVMSINDAYGRRTIPVEQIAQIHYVGAIVPPSKVRM